VRALRGFLFVFNVLPFKPWPPPPLSDVLVSSPMSESIQKQKTFSLYDQTKGGIRIG
jgi:hypothetical protein